MIRYQFVIVAGTGTGTAPVPAPAPPKKLLRAKFDNEEMFCHEKLQVYKQSVEFMGAIMRLIRVIPPGNADVVSQLRRAAMSIPLNIA